MMLELSFSVDALVTAQVAWNRIHASACIFIVGARQAGRYNTEATVATSSRAWIGRYTLIGVRMFSAVTRIGILRLR